VYNTARKCTTPTDTVRGDFVIEINEESNIPIYQQICDKIIRLIVLKVLKEGDKLPSVREFALILNINPNTIQKAYKSLENDHYIVSAKGKGNFVSDYSEIVKIYKKGLDNRFSGIIDEMILIGETKDSLVEYVSRLIEEKVQ